jgi:hypothetical protein
MPTNDVHTKGKPSLHTIYLSSSNILPPLLHQSTHKHMCVDLMTQVNRLLIIFASGPKNMTKQVIWGCETFGTPPLTGVCLE